ncbi:MAG: SDR family oxidoreductase [Gemmatimonadaceae bacterium]
MARAEPEAGAGSAASPASPASPASARTGTVDGLQVVVTGASRGIGLAIARRLVEEGARVAMLARTASDLQQEATLMGERAWDVPCDLADGGAVERALERILERMGPPDILVNNAGAFLLGALGSTSGPDVQRVFDVNLAAPYRLTNAVVPAMRERGRGHIVTIGSIADRHPFPENGAYAASKFGVRAMHEVLREELRGTGVRASLVSPGPVDTPLWDPIAPDDRPGFTPRASMLRAEAVADAVLWVVTRPEAVNIDELRLTRS